MQPNRVACPTEMAPASEMDVGTSGSGLKDQITNTAATHSRLVKVPEPGTRLEGHQPAWAVFKQCMLLGAAAFCAAPLILVLDIAERASLALCQMKQVRQQLAPPKLNSLAHQQHQPHQAESGSSQLISANCRGSGSSRSKAGFIRPNGNSSSQRPSDLWLLDLVPPFGFMALAVLPALLLAARHLLVGTAGVLQPLAWCVASLVLQGYANLILAVLQRGHPHPVGAAGALHQTEAAESARPFSSHRVHVGANQPYWWRPAAAAATGAGGCSSDPKQRHGVLDEETTLQQKISSKAYTPFKGFATTSKAAAGLFRLVQICGDAFRLWCICAVALNVWQQQAGAVLGWTSPLGALHKVVDGGVLSIVAAATSSAVGLQQNLGGMVWLLVDGTLCGGAATVYALALVARVLPIIDGLLQS